MCFCALSALKEKFEKAWRSDLKTENSIIDLRPDYINRMSKELTVKNPQPNN